MRRLLLLAALGAVVSGGPDAPAYDLRYRYAKDEMRRDVSSSAFRLRLFAQGKFVIYDQAIERELERTVVETDDAGGLVAERVEVGKFLYHRKESPLEEPGTKPYPSQGKAFVWRKKSDGDWALYDAGGDVSEKYPRLVEVLRNWGDARLPGKPVRAGDAWSVSAARFLETVGQPVPEGVEGECTFTLEEVDADGIARIGFVFRQSHRDGEHRLVGTQRGTWLFDVRRGRDLDFRMEGTVLVDGGEGGEGKFSMRRTLTWPDGSSATIPSGD